MSSWPEDQWRAPWRRVQLGEDSPEIELAPGVTARIAMTRQALVAMVTMAPGTKQPGRNHHGDTFVNVLAGDLQISADVSPEPEAVPAEGVLIIPAGRSYLLTAGPGGCTRMDVYVPPDMSLAEEAFHQEHSNHGFE
jgi:hypothetical protein